MPSPVYDPTLTDSLQTTGELIALKPDTSERIAWIIFLLDELSTMMPQQRYLDLLVGVQDHIGQHLSAESM